MTSPSRMNFRSPLALALLTGAFLTGPLTAGILQGPVTNPANGHTYYLLTQNTWTASEAEAITLSGLLVTVNDAAENEWIRTTFSNNNSHLPASPSASGSRLDV